MNDAATLWALVLTQSEPQVPQALRSAALAHLATVLSQPQADMHRRIRPGAVLAETPNRALAEQWQAELSNAGWQTEVRAAVPSVLVPPPSPTPRPQVVAPTHADHLAPAPAQMHSAAAPAHIHSAASAPTHATTGTATPAYAHGAAPEAMAINDDPDPLPIGRNHQKTMLGPISSIAGLRPGRFSFGHLLAGVFTRRTSKDMESYMSVGTLANTPPLAQVSAEWPQPWLFLRLLLVSIVVAVIFQVMVSVFQNPKLLPGLMVVGAFVVPLTVAVLIFELNAPRNVTLLYVMGLVLLGGALSLFFTLILFAIGPVLPSWVGASDAGPIEETAKLFAVVFATRKLSPVRYRYILNGMLFGAAVGAGFAAFESAGYAFETMLATKSAAGATGTTLFRGWLAPFGHVLWTALTAGALWRVKGAHSYSGAMLNDWRFLRIFFICVCAHALWNTHLIPVGPFFLRYMILGVLGWAIAFSLVQEGLEQIRGEQRTVGL